MALRDEFGGVEVAELEDEFGGVAVGETDEFGGVPVEDENLPPVRTPLDDRAILGDYLKQTTPEQAPDIRARPGMDRDVIGIAGDNIPTAFNGESVPQILSKFGSEVAGKPLELAGKAIVGGLNLPTTIQNFIEQDLMGSDKPPLQPIYEHGKPLLDIAPKFTEEELASMAPWQQRIAGGTAKVGEAISALTTPENIALLPAFGSAKIAKPLAGYLLGLVGLQEPAAIEKAIEVAQDPNATPFQAAEAFTEAAIVNPVFAALLAKQAKGPSGTKAAINALVEQLKQEPSLAPKTPESQRQLGVRIPEGENVLGTPELATLADRALQQGPNPPLARGEVSALERIRQELNPAPRMEAVEPARVAERTEGGGEAPYGKVSYQRQANPFFDRASESEGLGRASTPPTVESIRAQRAAEAKTNPVSAIESQPLSNWKKQVADSGFKDQTKWSYEFAEKNPSTTAADLLAAKQRALEAGKADGFPDQGMKMQFFSEAAKWRQALDEAAKLDKPTKEQLGKIEQEIGVGGLDRGAELLAALERNKPKPLNPGGALKDLPPELQAKSNAVKASMAEDFARLKAEVEATLESTPLDPQSGRSISDTQGFLDRANVWADEVLNRDPRLQTRSGLDPAQEATRLAAITVKGAILIRDGVTNFKEWSQRMIQEHGEGIRSQLNELWEKANNYAKSTQAESLETPKGGLRDNPSQRQSESPSLESGAPTISGGPERMRQSAARATTSENVPPPVQKQIAKAPESFYESQKYKTVEEAVAAAGDAELSGVPKDSNFYVASRLELSRRLFAQGKLKEGYEVFKEVSKQGTEWGQNINQFKMLKGTTPANIISLVNEGLKEAGRDPLNKKQMEDLAKTADESIQANRNLETAKQEWQKNPTDANAKKAQDLLDAANKADLNTQREMNRFKIKTWPQMLKTFAQGNPLTPISHVANFVGNTLGAAMEGSSRSVAALMDTVRAAMTGGDRKIAVGPRGFTEASKGFGRGLKQAPGILAKGSGDTVKGEYRAGLQPLRALAKAFAKNPDVPTVGGKVPINERIRLAVEGTFGIAPEAMLRLLSAADKPAYEAARARLINEQAKLKGVSAKDLKMAQKFPELFFDKETLSQIKLESADAIFQRPSKAVNMLQNLIREKGGDWGDLAFTIFVSPYKLTPWNLVVRTLQYNPLIAAAKTAIEAGKGNTRAAEISAGRMVVGSILYGAGYFLYQNGLIGPSLEGRSESQKSRLLSGEVLPPNHVNVSGLKRAAEGGDSAFKPGDETIDLTRGGGAAGAILSSVANIGRKMEKKPESGGGELAASLVRDGVIEQANFTINQSFLKGVTGVLDAIQNGNLGPYVNGVESMLLNVGTPNTLTALSRATRENAPDMKTDTVLKEFGNVVKNRFGIIGADDYLPAKRDLFGEPMPQTPEGRNAILYHLFDISKGRQVTDDPVKLELYRLWRRTASSEAIPSIPERQMTVDKKTYPLPTPLYSRFAELVGKERKTILDEMVQGRYYNESTDEEKISLLEKAYREGAAEGKYLFLKEHEAELVPVPERAGFKK